MWQGEKKGTSTLESSMGAEVLNKVIPIKHHRQVEEFMCVLRTLMLHLQHQTSEAAVQRAPTIYSQINSSPEESE